MYCLVRVNSSVSIDFENVMDVLLAIADPGRHTI